MLTFLEMTSLKTGIQHVAPRETERVYQPIPMARLVMARDLAEPPHRS